MNWTSRIAIGLLALMFGIWALSLASSYDVVLDVDVARANLGPNLDHLLGTDSMGRDVAWRLVRGTEAFVGPGLLACLLASLIGVPGGALAGWLQGPRSDALRFLFTVVSALPRFVLILLVCSIYGKETWILGVAAGVAYAPALSEAVYARVSSFRQAGFVMAGKAHGLRARRILGIHLVWVNCRALLGRHLLRLFAYFLLVETTLSFLGDFGVQEPQPSWGNMISRDALQGAGSDLNLWATFAPIAAIWLSIMACVLLAENLKEADIV